jgi:hypothetical protein
MGVPPAQSPHLHAENWRKSWKLEQGAFSSAAPPVAGKTLDCAQLPSLNKLPQAQLGLARHLLGHGDRRNSARFLLSW